MTIATTSVASTTSVTRTQYQPAPIRTPEKTPVQKEQEAPTLALSGGSQIDQIGDGTGSTYSILA